MQTDTLRKCMNIKSRKAPDQQCSLQATHGDFCARHEKHPVVFPKRKNISIPSTRSTNSAAVRIQKSWRFFNGLRRNRNQGPAATFPELASNSTEVSSFENVKDIPILYRFSYGDIHKIIWVFDLRTIFQLIGDSGNQIQNPYTRDEIQPQVLDRLHARIQNLRKKRYCLMWINGTELSAEQVLHQRVVDLCLKFDVLGYYTSPAWFEDLELANLKMFYNYLYGIFILTHNIEQQTIQNIVGQGAPLFTATPARVNGRKDKKSLQQVLLDILERIISTAQDKQFRSLGALYALKAWATAHPVIYRNYPWLV